MRHRQIADIIMIIMEEQGIELTVDNYRTAVWLVREYVRPQYEPSNDPRIPGASYPARAQITAILKKLMSPLDLKEDYHEWN